MEVLPHAHPLKLIDLNPEYPHDEVVYDDEEELIMKQDFRCPCGRCGQEINFYHRYYYTCDQCDYSLHKLCAELPTTLKHEYHHDHTLILCQLLETEWCLCQVCKRKHLYQYLYYHCAQCDVAIGLGCTKINVQNLMIYHPSHGHPLMPIYRKIKANCDACGTEQVGNFYQCTTCSNFFAHSDCVFLRKKLLIQHFRKDNSFHTHPITLAYSFPRDDQKAKFHPRCKVCDLQFDENLWIYKCEKCRYYVHTDCATTSKEGSLVSVLFNEGTSKPLKNYKDDDYPDLLHLPFLDQTSQTKVLKHLFYGESGSRAFETNLTHPFHQHPLTLVGTPCCNNDITTTPTSSRIITSSSHDSMKMVQVLCDACIRPITNMPFYKCTASDEGCNFVLHVWCTRLPTEVKMDTRRGIRTLKLLPAIPFATLGLFRSLCCMSICNGFVYSDEDKYSRRSYEADVSCGVTPEFITHKSHPNHLLRKLKSSIEMYCRLCLSDAKTQLFYGCENCKFYLHPMCALFWPDTIRHKYDKHPMTLRYFPVENYNGDYFCEVCEEEFNPNAAFYHCDQCVQSIHRPCVEFIFQEARTWAPFLFDRGVDQFESVKSRIFTFKGHPHPLSVFRGPDSDGDCTLCGSKLQDYWIILKCLQCKFEIDKMCCRKIE
ncbi:B-box-type zinc finger, Zinc finger, PHD-type, DC1 [Artemisia annua]|uniref:B-box-type zinc finger, Zinc finger, PHD-type, DC1 n=1 Tax=Artemisia annua TaxID=35608 RepID=A0A2U1MQ55_ARTAN|nr:B-box-type zinc finger, Zinc finger, PHD-type, DC1 [Artemisia annua]